MEQVYEHYTIEDQEVWRVLFDRQYAKLPDFATSKFLEGIKKVNFSSRQIPSFEETNQLLRDMTGWELTAVSGIVDDRDFFKLLSEKKFPATTWLRKMSELDYLEEPDMFHDVFGHVPLLTNLPFVNFLQGLSKLALKYIDNLWAIELLSRIYWFTVEFGLIQEEQTKIYGAGILSSVGETKHSLSKAPEHYPYDVEKILGMPYRKDVFQEKYFVIGSYEQLYDSIDAIEAALLTMLAMKPG